MTTTTIRGHVIDLLPIRDSHSRRATQFTNKLLAAFKAAGISPDAVDIPEERAPMRKAPAEVSWYIDGRHCHYSYALRSNYTENLAVVLRVLELELKAVGEGTKAAEEFINDFTEEEDIRDRRKDARKLLGVAEDCMDLPLIDTHYKKLAKNTHPDMPNGSTEDFKKLNHAHKMLKRELK